MKMTSEKRAIDKLYRRRDRYELPSWQRGEVWSREKKQRLIDSILRGWKLPKFYFIKTDDDQFLIEDGQQRFSAILEFFSGDLSLRPETVKEFGGRLYRDLPSTISDAFDDFEIEYDLIEGASDEELKEFFQRLQEGMPLTSSEKLNAVHSKLRDFCRKLSKHSFFTKTVSVSNTRFAHFDIIAKAATIEIEGLDASLRFEDIKQVFLSNAEFSTSSSAAKRLKAALNVLDDAFRKHGDSLKTRTVVQSLITLTCKLVSTGHTDGYESSLRKFFERFLKELTEQVEMGPSATDSDYIRFQLSVNANVAGSAKERQQILLRKIFTIAPDLAKQFDPTVIAESGSAERISTVAENILELISRINTKFAGKHGDDLFKATNKTAAAQARIRKPIKDLDGYKNLIDELYFLFRESVGQRLANQWPDSFIHIKDLRTDIRHDVDHGDASSVRTKRKRVESVFASYAGTGTPETTDVARFQVFQMALLERLERDLRTLLASDL